MVGWRIAQQGINPAGRDLVEWSDSGGRTRPATDQVTARYYMVADASIDSNGNGDPDSREIFLDDNYVLAGTFRGAGRNRGGHGDSNVSRNPHDPRVSTERIMYVDQTIGRDLLTGRSPIVVGNDGPKKTIRAGIGDATEGDQMIIKTGRYRESVDFSEKDLNVVMEGDVDLRTSSTSRSVQTLGSSQPKDLLVKKENKR